MTQLWKFKFKKSRIIKKKFTFQMNYEGFKENNLIK